MTDHIARALGRSVGVDVVGPIAPASAETPVTALTLTALEEQLAAQLERAATARGASAKAVAWPDDPLDYPLKSDAAYLLAYAGGEFGAPQDVSGIVQPREFRWAVIVLARSLADRRVGARGVSGAYAHLELAREALVGFKAPGCTRLVALRERFVGRKDGVWCYALTVGARGTLVAAIAAPGSPELPAAQHLQALGQLPAEPAGRGFTTDVRSPL